MQGGDTDCDQVHADDVMREGSLPTVRSRQLRLQGGQTARQGRPLKPEEFGFCLQQLILQ